MRPEVKRAMVRYVMHCREVGKLVDVDDPIVVDFIDEWAVYAKQEPRTAGQRREFLEFKATYDGVLAYFKWCVYKGVLSMPHNKNWHLWMLVLDALQPHTWNDFEAFKEDVEEGCLWPKSKVDGRRSTNALQVLKDLAQEVVDFRFGVETFELPMTLGHTTFALVALEAVPLMQVMDHVALEPESPICIDPCPREGRVCHTDRL